MTKFEATIKQFESALTRFRDKQGFTLIEVLIYVAITAVVGGLMVGILLSVSQVHLRESASTEVTGQLNFVTQTIGRLVRSSSNIEIDAGIPTSTIKLRMQDDSKDPTYISLVDGVIKLTEGTAAASDLTNTRVTVNALNFKKFVQYPGHDTVSYDIQMTYNSQNPKAQVQRSLSSGIARVSAATFDSNLLPGNTTYEIGQTGSAWKNLYLSGVLNLGTSANDPTGVQNGSMYYNTTNNIFRGYKSGAWSNIGGDLWTASSTAIYYNTGNVGIGTTGPEAKLHIGNTAANTALTSYINNTSNTTGSEAVSFLRVGGASAGNAYTRYEVAGINTWTAGSLTLDNTYRISTNADLGTNTRLAITTGGNVGIGTTNPTATLFLSSATFTSPTTVGINPQQAVTAQSTALNIVNNMTNTTTDGINKRGIFLESLDPFTGGAGAATNNYGIYIDRVFGADNNYAFVTTADSGNVGIGTTGPSSKLQVSGDWVPAQLTVTNPADSLSGIGFTRSGSAQEWMLYRYGSSAADKFCMGINGVNEPLCIATSGYVSMPGGHGDLAENYHISGTVLRGGLVSANNTIANSAIASSPTQLSLIGVVSTKPGAVMDVDGGFQVGSDTKPTYTHEKAPITLVGAVPTLVTSQNGSINMGDAIGISTISGFGAKKITAGNIVGKALEKLDSGDTCQIVSSIDAIVWPEDDGKNSLKPCFKLPDGTYVGKIMVAISVSWYDPGADVLTINSSGNVGIGTTGPGYTLTVNGTAWVTSGAWSGSDIRWKKDITPLSPQGSLDKVMQLNPVSFDWRTDEFPDLRFSSGSQLGFIAQDVEKIIPEVVTTDNNGYKGMSYERITPMLTAAIQEQQKQIEELKSENEKLESRIKFLENH